MTEVERLTRVEKRAKEAEQTLEQLKKYVDVMMNSSGNSAIESTKAEIQNLSDENLRLEKEVEKLRAVLVSLEIENGVVQVPPAEAVKQQTPLPISTKADDQVTQNKGNATDWEGGTKQKSSKEVTQEKKKSIVEEGKPNKKSEEASNDETMDVSKLDMRVGRIMNVQRHPDADSLYVEEVDVGEAKARTVVSGLVKHIPLEEMQNRMVVLLCNLKPAKMRGVTSEAMVMCGSSPEKVEIIDPPPGSVPGDRITFKGYPGTPDAQLNPKKKIFEQVQPELRVSEEGVACYRGVPFTVEGKGVCKVISMKNSAIK